MKRIGLLIILMCILFLSACIPSHLRGEPGSFVIRRDFRSDATRLIYLIENIHPAFILEGRLPGGYESARVRFLMEAGERLSNAEFTLTVMRYLAAVGDGYMSYAFNARRNFRFFNIDWVLENDRLFLLENGVKTSAEVLYLGGVPVRQVLEFAQRHFHACN